MATGWDQVPPVSGLERPMLLMTNADADVPDNANRRFWIAVLRGVDRFLVEHGPQQRRLMVLSLQ